MLLTHFVPYDWFVCVQAQEYIQAPHMVSPHVVVELQAHGTVLTIEGDLQVIHWPIPAGRLGIDVKPWRYNIMMLQKDKVEKQS